MRKNVYCPHITKKTGTLYIYEIIGKDICLCTKCERKLRAKIIEQDKFERELKCGKFKKRKNGISPPKHRRNNKSA
jgi:hypothetical protein